MKLKYILPILFIALFASCSSNDDNDDAVVIPETEGLIKVQDISNTTHNVEVFSKSGNLQTGYNDIYLRIKDLANDSYIETATINWMPMMEMPTMQHSSPKSMVAKTAGKNTIFNGHIIFQMTGMNGMGWSLKVMYTIDDQDYEAESTITVQQSTNQNVSVVMGSDATKYIIALIEPKQPEIAINDMVVGLYKMENMMSFPVVEDYTITLDPRMPAMGNHSSPNNTDLTYNSTDQMYHGNLSLTMTGFWNLNLKLLNDLDEVLKGEDVTDITTKSSLYLELEF